MSPAIPERVVWSRSQWLGAITLIVALHLVGLFGLSKRSKSGPSTRPELANLYFAGELDQDSRLAELLSLQDPMVFAQIDPQSCSGQSLLTTSRFSYDLANWTEPYRWLAPSDQYFADDFSFYVANTVRPSTLLTQKVPPALSEVAPSTPAMPPHALLRIEGDLAGRRLISNQPLPVNESTAILTNTVLRVSVLDATGDAFSAALIFSSGWPKADQSALAFARQARFERGNQANNGPNGATEATLTVGQFVFQWFPMTVAATNQLTSKP